MKCKDEAEVLSELAGQQLKIDSIYLLKFGTISIANGEPADDSEQPFTDRSEVTAEFDDDDGLASCRKLGEVIESHPNIFDFQTLSQTFPASEYISLGMKLLNGPIYRASVHLPKKQQKYQEMDCQEHFSVLLSGTYFAAFTQVESLHPFSNMAHEFREIFRSQVLGKTSWKSPIVGPCPIHQNLVVIGVTAQSNTKTLTTPLFYLTGRNLFIIVDKHNTAETIAELFDDCLIYLGGFYELALQRLELIYIDSEIQLRMVNLVRAHAKFSIASFWQFKIVHRFLAIARDELAHIYELRVTHSRGVSDYKRSRQRFLEQLRESELLGSLKTELKSDTIMDVDVPDTLLPSIQFFQTQADAKRGAYSLFLASLFGALVGGALALAATLLHGQK
jgi:hypothetical protein